ncbi:MAG: membrane protein insertion efficiency factor YidD [Deltaproteobacteria bacterium]|nr:membrane protein insertion efficiency factor YidD [Deltaproteobacteria bacterium]
MIIKLIQLYQRWISPVLPASCRFAPTCSDYARQSFERYPTLKGFFLTVKRIVKCHPYCEGGIDPVP